ncbi:MAG: hypothetical protein AB7U98_14845 [Candidatus Nitrosocosmicus sp.]
MKDNNGTITQLGFEDKSIHSAFIIAHLILSEKISLSVKRNGNRLKVGVKGSICDNEFFISDEEIVDIDELNFIPTCNN